MGISEFRGYVGGGFADNPNGHADRPHQHSVYIQIGAAGSGSELYDLAGRIQHVLKTQKIILADAHTPPAHSAESAPGYADSARWA